MLLLRTKVIADNLIEIHKQVIIKGQTIPIRPLITKAVRVIISNASADIPNGIIKDELVQQGVNLVSEITDIKAGLTAKLASAKEYLQTLEPTAGLENHIDIDITAQIFQDTYGQKDTKNTLESHMITADTEYLYDIQGNLHGIVNDRSIKDRITKLKKKMFSAPSDAILSEDDYTTDSSQNQ
ncbi:hypothetical protein HHI36_019694 [Cryptolaemus montrouzieri]|uniref:Uncharacterized protein n=1 Tax=Cryptolaemus montrouzieri TaxID=559131 RepID=A0ABD2N870_9CUCU